MVTGCEIYLNSNLYFLKNIRKNKEAKVILRKYALVFYLISLNFITFSEEGSQVPKIIVKSLHFPNSIF